MSEISTLGLCQLIHKICVTILYKWLVFSTKNIFTSYIIFQKKKKKCPPTEGFFQSFVPIFVHFILQIKHKNFFFPENFYRKIYGNPFGNLFGNLLGNPLKTLFTQIQQRNLNTNGRHKMEIIKTNTNWRQTFWGEKKLRR